MKGLVVILMAVVFIWGNFARASDYDFDPPDIPDRPDFESSSISGSDSSGAFTSFDRPDRVDYTKQRSYEYDSRRTYPIFYDRSRRDYGRGRAKRGVRHRRYETLGGTPKPLEQIRGELKERTERLKKLQSEK